MRKLIVHAVAKPLCLVLALCFITVDLGIRTAHAGMISTETVLAAQAGDDARVQVAAFLARDDVRQALTAHGVAPEEVAVRVAGLSDAEIMQIAGQLDQLPAGASSGFIAASILLFFLILLITDIMGYTNVFTFTKSVR